MAGIQGYKTRIYACIDGNKDIPVGHGSQRLRFGPSGKAGPGSGAACASTLLLRCYRQRPLLSAVLPASNTPVSVWPHQHLIHLGVHLQQHSHKRFWQPVKMTPHNLIVACCWHVPGQGKVSISA